MKDLISVIIPVYKMEKFIEKCLESICNSSYKNLQIICVDDGSPDNSVQLIRNIQQHDDRIVVLKNAQNLGLFRARVEGLKVAKGEFVAFVDADDFVGVDWFRLLHQKITQENSEMVVGNTVNVDENMRYTYFNNYRSFNVAREKLQGDEVAQAFLQQEGSCFLWHTVWNKLYRRSLLDRCLPYFSQIDFHLIMCEDVLFSSVVYAQAQSMSFVYADAYFYLRHSQASTSTTLPFERILRNIADAGNAFRFFKTFFVQIKPKIFLENQRHYVNFLEKYRRIWSGVVVSYGKTHDNEALNTLEQAFGSRKVEKPHLHEFYFCEHSTEWSGELERAKQLIALPDTEVVSFDIFDTLLLRPLYSPVDLYKFVGKVAATLVPSMTEETFVDMRMLADAKAREIAGERLRFEDITLAETYKCLEKIADIDFQTAQSIMQAEIEVEKRFCYPRNTAKQLFQLAKHLNKRIVVTSDMYLERDTVENLLVSNGYDGYERLFLSSEQRKLKRTGSLFDVMIKQMGVPAWKIVHIGDNWESDIVAAKQKGISTFHLPKATMTMENKFANIFTGNSLSFYLSRNNTLAEQTQLTKDLSVRCMLGVVANKLFDNPFVPFNEQSQYNADAYHTGYATLGMHMFALARWMLHTAQQKGYKKIVFLARDGLLAKQVFDLVAQSTGVQIETEYFFASRKALLPYSVENAQDLFFTYEYFNLNEKVHTGRKILQLLSPVLLPLTDKLAADYKQDGVDIDEYITDKAQFMSFMRAVAKHSFDIETCNKARTQMRRLFQQHFTENCATFDIGYSGKLQKIICKLADRKVDVFYLHSNGYTTQEVAQNLFETHCFYDFTPTISAIIREFFISKKQPACIGYEVGDTLKPIFEDRTFAYDETYAIERFQQGALDFCKDFLKAFPEATSMPLRNLDASLPFENYLLNAPYLDREVFDTALEEDDIYSGYQQKSICDIWSWHIDDINHAGKGQQPVQCSSVEYYISRFPKWKRAMFFLLFDRKTFWQKLKKNLSRKKH